MELRGGMGVFNTEKALYSENGNARMFSQVPSLIHLSTD